VGIHLYVDSGIRLIKSLRLCDVLERFYGWVRGIQGLVLGGIHHETAICPSTNQGAVNADCRSCPALEHVAANREHAQDRNCHCSFEYFSMLLRPPRCSSGAQFRRDVRFSAMEAE